MNVVYACDDKYAMLVGASMQSLLESNCGCEDLQIFVMTNEVSEENKNKLSAVAKSHQKKVFIIDTAEKLLNDDELKVDTQRWSIAAFARLYAPQLLPEVERIIYLDCDTIIRHSLSEVWNTELGGKPCAAVAEPFSYMHKANLNMDVADTYYNSGVMLIDLDQWRRTNAKSKFESVIKRHSGKVPYVDQGVLNEAYKDQILCLPAKYNVYTEYYDFTYDEVNQYRADRNVYSKEEIEEAKCDPVVVHFVSSFLSPRPWVENSTHPYAKEWKDACQKTPWANAEKWSDRPGKEKIVIRWIFKHISRPLGLSMAKLANSYIRPYIDRENIIV